jgi:hypothetical protein
MNILKPENQKPWLEDAITQIHFNLIENCTKYQELHIKIYVATWDEVRNQYQKLESLFNKGFGLNLKHRIAENKDIWLIVLNEQIVRNANLTEEELRAIILHELGHFLNYPALEDEPYPGKKDELGELFSSDTIKLIKSQNSKKKEIYADAYAKKFGFQQCVLNSFEKHHILIGSEIGFLNDRVDAINSDELFIGGINLPDIKGF